jgi:hypothetical protein
MVEERVCTRRNGERPGRHRESQLAQQTFHPVRGEAITLVAECGSSGSDADAER